MSIANEMIGSVSKDVKDILLKLMEKGESSEDILRETEIKVKKWTVWKQNGEIDEDELEMLVETRKKTLELFFINEGIADKARIEQVTTRVIEIAFKLAVNVIV